MAKLKKLVFIQIVLAIIYFGLGTYNYFIIGSPLNSIYYMLASIFLIGLAVCSIILNATNVKK